MHITLSWLLLGDGMKGRSSTEIGGSDIFFLLLIHFYFQTATSRWWVCIRHICLLAHPLTYSYSLILSFNETERDLGFNGHWFSPKDCFSHIFISFLRESIALKLVTRVSLLGWPSYQYMFTLYPLGLPNTICLTDVGSISLHDHSSSSQYWGFLSYRPDSYWMRQGHMTSWPKIL